jgi:hypothetical protein
MTIKCEYNDELALLGNAYFEDQREDRETFKNCRA